MGILSAHLLLAAPLLVVIVGALVVNPAAYASLPVFGVVGFFFGITIVAALVPWDRIRRVWGMLLPFADIAGVLVLREFMPDLGIELLVLVPIIWIARSFGPIWVTIGVVAPVAAMWVVRFASGRPPGVEDVATFVVVPVLIGFVAGTVYLASSRGRAQTQLLTRHAGMVRAALDTARRQEELLVAVLNAVVFGVIAFDRTGAVTFVNRAHRQSLTDFGASPDAIVHPIAYQADGMTRFRHEDHPVVRALAGQAFDNIVTWIGEPGSRRAALSVSSRLIRDSEGEYDGGVIVLADITAELDAVRARNDLVGSVSHELRSPLTSILGYLDLVQDDPRLEPETRRMLEVAAANSERLLVLVTDLLRAASDSDQQLAMTFVPCDIAQLARDAVTAHQVLAGERDVELTIAGPDSAPATADPVRIRQVLDNLITNAIKYNLEWGSVTVTVGMVDSGVSVEIRDTGQGIPAADLPRVFDRFYRTASARTSSTVGTGLGLSITRDIVESHGGRLSVESELGIGTTFRLIVPGEPSGAPVSARGKTVTG